MAAPTITRSEDPFALADRLRKRQLWQATLADCADNPDLAAWLREQAAGPAKINGMEYIELPPLGTIVEVWRELGFCYDEAYGDWRVGGIWRRLAATIRSIRERGFDNREIQLGAGEGNGFYAFTWESLGGRWKTRHWRVEGKLRYSRSRLEITDVVIYVEGWQAKQEGRAEWSAFVGAALNVVLSERLSQVLAVIAARLIRWNKIMPPYDVWVDGLTRDERVRHHDLHPSPVAAFRRADKRVVLWDDLDGSGSLAGDSGEFEHSFVQAALGYLTS